MNSSCPIAGARSSAQQAGSWPARRGRDERGKRGAEEGSGKGHGVGGCVRSLRPNLMKACFARLFPVCGRLFRGRGKLAWWSFSDGKKSAKPKSVDVSEHVRMGLFLDRLPARCPSDSVAGRVQVQAPLLQSECLPPMHYGRARRWQHLLSGPHGPAFLLRRRTECCAPVNARKAV